MINTMTIDGYDAVIQSDPDIKMFRGASFEGFEMDFSCTQIRAVGH
jgi:predicted HicB family RNase H-like nuclease